MSLMFSSIMNEKSMDESESSNCPFFTIKQGIFGSKSNPLETDIFTWIEDTRVESKPSIDTNWDNEPDLMS